MRWKGMLCGMTVINLEKPLLFRYDKIITYEEIVNKKGNTELLPSYAHNSVESK